MAILVGRWCSDSRIESGMGFGSELGSSSVVLHDTWPPSLLHFRKCGWSYIMDCKEGLFFFSGICSTFGWNQKRILLQLNLIHQHNSRVWVCISVVNAIPDVRLPNPLYKFHLSNNTQLHTAQTLTSEDTGEGNNQEFWTWFWICLEWDGKWHEKSWYCMVAQSLSIE